MEQQDISLKNMVLAFRVTELQTLLSYAGKNRSGRKNELQARALELVKSKQSPVTSKIRELYKSIQLSTLQQLPPASAGIINTGGHNLNLAHIQSYGSNQQQQQLQQMSSNNNSNLRIYGTTPGPYSGAADKALMGRNPFSNTNYPAGIKLPGLQAISMPICPDVKMKKLPFYDILHVLHKPSSLIANGPRGMQDSLFTFCFTPSQASDVASSKEYNFNSPSDSKIQYAIQVQLRFCATDSTSEHDDLFPPSIVVKVNGKLIPLPHPIPSNRPGVEAKRPSRPLNVTNYCKLSPMVTNNIHVSWSADANGRGFCMSLFMVKKLCSSDLLQRLKTKGPRPAEYTRGMIKEICMKDDVDCCIATTTLKVSIACPLGKSRMSIPCRASTCSHLQCFDANLFVQMNEKKPTWVCPVCDKPTLFDNLSIDGYFEDVIAKMPINEGNDIEIMPDASWNSIKKEKDDGAPPTKKLRTGISNSSANRTICIDDDIIIEDDPDEITNSSAATEKPKEKSVEIVDLTLSSDSEEEEEPPMPATPEKRPPGKPLVPVVVVQKMEPAKEVPVPTPSVQTRKDLEDGEVKDSSDEDSFQPVRRQPTRQARPTFLHDESSSSSSASDSSASTRAPDSPKSPQCITLDSASSSSSEPEPVRHKPKTSRFNYNNATNSFLSSGSSFCPSVAPAPPSIAQTSNVNNYTTSVSHPLPNPRYNDTSTSNNYMSQQSSMSGAYQPPPGLPTYRPASGLSAPPPPVLRSRSPIDHHHGMPMGGMTYASTQPMGSFLPYDSRAWDPTGFASATDFASLDYPSMDYFNQTPTYATNPSSTRSGHNYNAGNTQGSNSGYNGPTW